MHMIPTRHPGLATTGIRFQAHDLRIPKILGLVRFEVSFDRITSQKTLVVSTKLKKNISQNGSFEVGLKIKND